MVNEIVFTTTPSEAVTIFVPTESSGIAKEAVNVPLAATVAVAIPTSSKLMITVSPARYPSPLMLTNNPMAPDVGYIPIILPFIKNWFCADSEDAPVAVMVVVP